MIIVYSYYVLDILHEGHLLQMRNAKAMAGPAGRSIVAILTDDAVAEKKKRPVLPFCKRMILAAAIKWNDIVIPQSTYSPLSNVRSIRPDVLIESASHSNTMLHDASQLMSELDGRLIITPYFPGQSSSAIKKEVKNVTRKRTP